MSYSGVPGDWRTASLEDCVDILDSQRVPVNNKERQARVRKKLPDKLYPYFGATGEVGKIDDYLFDEELVALGEDGVPFLDQRKPKAYMLVGKTWVNNHAHVLRAADGVTTNRFLLHYLNQFDYQEFVNGGTRLKLTQANMRRMPFLLPHLAEQTVIADKLDTLLAQVENTKARLERIPKILKRFRQSVLSAAVSGRLTEEWRRSNPAKTTESLLSAHEPLPRPARWKSRSESFIAGDYAIAVGKPESSDVEGWSWVPLVEVARMESGHTPSRSRPEYWGGEVCWIGIRDANLNHGRTILSTEQKTNEIGLANSASRLLPAGTVCISRTASVGYVVKMGKDMATSQDFVNWVPTKVIDSDWLKWLFVAERESLFRFGKGSTHTTVYFPEWLAMHILLPHIDEQREIARRLDQLLARADHLEQQVNNALARVNGLTQSILTKAFRGELTEQWRKDNPELISGENSAEALLGRIERDGMRLSRRQKSRL